jgi:tRNA (guanine-N7-)-methyltransferase
MEEMTDIWRGLATIEGVIDFGDWFGSDGPVEMEIGAGKGRFLADSARQRPDVHFVGADKDGKFLRIAYEKIIKRELPNVRFVHGDMIEMFAEHIAEGSVQTVHVYFPDPWPKRRHAKRRMFQDGVAQSIARALSADGRLFFKTDVPVNFTRIRRAVNDSGCFELEEARCWRAGEAVADNVPTNYEVKYVAVGKEVFYARWRKRPAPDR